MTDVRNTIERQAELLLDSLEQTEDPIVRQQVLKKAFQTNDSGKLIGALLSSKRAIQLGSDQPAINARSFLLAVASGT